MAKRTTMNISLPKATRDWVEHEVRRGGFGSASEYFRHLARQEQKRQAEEKLEQVLLEGMRGPGRELTDADWNRIKARIRAGAVKRRKRAG